MKLKILLIMVLVLGTLYANDNINNSGTFSNYGTITNNQINNYDSEKIIFDARIKKLSSQLIQSSNNENNKYTPIIAAASEVNKFNVDANIKKEKCIEYALSLSFIKIDASFARKECNKIFN